MTDANKYGRFIQDRPGSYELTSQDMETSWQYIYQNGQMLLRVDQFGPVDAQLCPPQDIQLFRRERDEKYARWTVWARSKQLRGGEPFCCFGRPAMSGRPGDDPDQLRVIFAPEQAEYLCSRDGLELSTKILLPQQGAVICMEFTARNTTSEPLQLELTPVLVPYVNQARIAPWDKPEWYLRTGLGFEQAAVFYTRLYNAQSDAAQRRAVALWSSPDGLSGAELSLESFLGRGDLQRPEGAWKETLSIQPGDWGGYAQEQPKHQIYGYPPVYALRYSFTLQPGESAQIHQVLCAGLNEQGGPGTSFPPAELARLLNPETLNQERECCRRFFEQLFAKRRIHTADPELDRYVNEWLPLQMHWVAALDRGWPTGMRGTRDCANDLMGYLQLDPAWCREILLLVLECQRSDGWFPRQVSTRGRRGEHDLRPFVDGGAFVMEALHEYLCATGDVELLSSPVPWLDSDETSTVLEHAVRAMEYYCREENIGEHGLCKIRGGDWLDAVNRAGLEGRGESLMVTAQVIMAISWLEEMGRAASRPVPDLSGAQKKFANAVATAGWDEQAGFFRGVFTDAGQWVFSGCDPDGESRPYACANAYALLCGAASPEQTQRTLSALESLRTPMGYRLFTPPLGRRPVEKLGRSGSGDGLEGLFENGAPYNHGSHGFVGRAMAHTGQEQQTLDILRCMLPCCQDIHPTEKAVTPPYAMVNCWQMIPGFTGHGGMLFLTGAIAMALRLTYNWMLGVQPEMKELCLQPCFQAQLGTVRLEMQLRGKTVQLEMQPDADMLLVNGKPGCPCTVDEVSGKKQFHIPYEDLENLTVIRLVKN